MGLTIQEKLEVTVEVVKELIAKDGKKRALTGLMDGYLTVATAGEKGHNPTLLFAGTHPNQPTLYDAACDLADKGNELLGLSDQEAATIVCSSMF